MKEEYNISVIIPVIGGDKDLESLLNKLLSSSGNLIKEVIISVGDEQQPFCGDIPDTRIRIVSSPKGRGTQFNRGAVVATAPILLFLHADTIIPEGGLERIVALMYNPNLAGGAFDLYIDAIGFQYRLIEKVASLRSRITRIPFGDQAIFVRRRLFEEIGGFHEIPLMEDVELMRRIKRLGHRISFVSLSVKTSARRWLKKGILRTTLNNWKIQLLFLVGIKPERLANIYYGNKKI
ncbi:MAG: TIGR04283 family arsenosugar biosynthesis glycosyltransferase [Nitrospinota bacterium]|nr:TIGR04283 family arsenosugar biosynthesis glycosyltransferase [Nitrospinota bacterium]